MEHQKWVYIAWLFTFLYLYQPHMKACILHFYFWWKKVPFLCVVAKTIMSFQWKTLHFKHHHSLTKEESRDDGENRDIELLLSADFFNTEERSLLIPRGEDRFLKSLSGILYKYNFLVNVKGKELVSCIELKITFLSWYFWTLFPPPPTPPHPFIIWWHFCPWIFYDVWKWGFLAEIPYIARATYLS